MAAEDTDAVPAEVDGIAGFSWGDDIKRVAERLDKEITASTKQISLSDQLQLDFPAGTLARATLTTQGVDLRDSAPKVKRWGTPIRTTLLVAVSSNGHLAGCGLLPKKAIILLPFTTK